MTPSLRAIALKCLASKSPFHSWPAPSWPLSHPKGSKTMPRKPFYSRLLISASSMATRAPTSALCFTNAMFARKDSPEVSSLMRFSKKGVTFHRAFHYLVSQKEIPLI